MLKKTKGTERGGIRGLAHFYDCVSYRMFVARPAKFATDPAYRCTLLHAGVASVGAGMKALSFQRGDEEPVSTCASLPPGRASTPHGRTTAVEFQESVRRAHDLAPALVGSLPLQPADEFRSPRARTELWENRSGFCGGFSGRKIVFSRSSRAFRKTPAEVYVRLQPSASTTSALEESQEVSQSQLRLCGRDLQACDLSGPGQLRQMRV